MRGADTLPTAEVNADQPVKETSIWRDRCYLLLSAGNMVLTLHDSVLFTLRPLAVSKTMMVEARAVGPLLAVNTVLTVVRRVPLTRWADGVPLARRADALGCVKQFHRSARRSVCEQS